MRAVSAGREKGQQTAEDLSHDIRRRCRRLARPTGSANRGGTVPRARHDVRHAPSPDRRQRWFLRKARDLSIDRSPCRYPERRADNPDRASPIVEMKGVCMSRTDPERLVEIVTDGADRPAALMCQRRGSRSSAAGGRIRRRPLHMRPARPPCRWSREQGPAGAARHGRTHRQRGCNRARNIPATA